MNAVAGIGGDVLLEQRDAVFWITIHREDKRNALNASVIAGLREGLRQAHALPAVRAIVLTAAGERAFCAGGDLQPGQGFAFDLSRPNGDYADLLREARGATLPIVARVNGACMAGGMGLLCMADMAVAADHAVFGLPEVKIGLFPVQVLSLLQEPGGPPHGARMGTHRRALHRRRGPAGRPGQPRRGRGRPGCQDPMAGRSAGRQIPTAIRRGKYAMRAMAAMPFDQAIAYAEGQIVLMPMTEDAREGMAAFNAKRKPRWTGR